MFLAESHALDLTTTPLGIEVFFLVYGPNLPRSAVDHSVSGTTPRGTNRHPPDADWSESSEPNMDLLRILIDFS